MNNHRPCKSIFFKDLKINTSNFLGILTGVNI